MALTFRDIDRLTSRYPGSIVLLVSPANYALLTSNASAESSSRASSEEGGRKVRYVPARQPTVHNILPDLSVLGDDIIIRS